MRKLMKQVALCLTFAAAVLGFSLVRDRNMLDRGLIRLHIVANSDSETDQQIKLQVRDAVIESLRQAMSQATNPEEARAYLQQQLPKIQDLANDTLETLGCSREAVATLCREAFGVRHYDTFSLPSGIYESLRITIGEGDGHNWWCVAFPTLCLPATSEGFEDTAAGAGFSEPLLEALEEPCEIRFYLLDVLGKLQTRFFGSP